MLPFARFNVAQDNIVPQAESAGVADFVFEEFEVAKVLSRYPRAVLCAACLAQCAQFATSNGLVQRTLLHASRSMQRKSLHTCAVPSGEGTHRGTQGAEWQGEGPAWVRSVLHGQHGHDHVQVRNRLIPPKSTAATKRQRRLAAIRVLTGVL